jgi:hypothetical protein
MSTKPLLVLLDADVIIELHRVGAWNALLQRYRIGVFEIIARREVMFWKNERGERVDIELNEYEKTGLIQIHSASIPDLQGTLQAFSADMRDRLHSGEIEAISVLRRLCSCQEALFCTGDRKACEAVVLLGLSENGISLERLLSRAGLKKPIRMHFTESRFKKIQETASVQRITGEDLSSV